MWELPDDGWCSRRRTGEIHQIRIAHAWSNETRGFNPHALRRAIRDRIDGAIEFRDSLSRPMQSRVDAGSLDTWRGLV